MTATSKLFYVNGTQIGPDAAMTLGGHAGAVTLNLVDPLDWGSADKEIFKQPRPSYGDGDFRRGARWKPRSNAQLNIGGHVNAGVVGMANIEAYRDAGHEAVLDLLSGAGLSDWKVSRLGIDSVTNLRVLRAEVTSLPAWKWSPDQYGPGYVGRHDMPHFVVPVMLDATFPWFIDTGATATANVATARWTSVGAGSVAIPFTVKAGKDLGAAVQVAVYADSPATTDLNIVITGAGPALVGTRAVYFNNVSITSTVAAIADSYYSDPMELDFFRGTGGASSGTSLWDNLIPGTRDLMAYKGANTITVSWPTDIGFATVEVRWKGWWGDP